MRTGFNLLLWTTHVTEEHYPILRALKETGYDEVEIPVFQGDPDHYARLGAELDRLGLGSNDSQRDRRGGEQPAFSRGGGTEKRRRLYALGY